MVLPSNSSFPKEKRPEFIAPKVTLEPKVWNARRATDHSSDVAQEYTHSSDHVWLLEEAIAHNSDNEVQGRPHEPLALSPAHPPGPNTDLARSHLAQMNNSQFRLVGGSGNPAIHPTHVPVYAIPPRMSKESTDGMETSHSIEFSRTNRVLISHSLGNQLP